MGPAVVDVKSECSLVMHYRLFGYHLSPKSVSKTSMRCFLFGSKIYYCTPSVGKRSVTVSAFGLKL